MVADYAWARACLRSRSNMDAMTLFSVLMVRRAADASFCSSDTRTTAELLTVRPANLQVRDQRTRVSSKTTNSFNALC